MKIIEWGKDPDGKPIEATCRSCLTKVQFTRNDPDVRLVPDHRDGDFWQFKCPCCGESVTKQWRPM